ncbi:hypothetical protein K439DRAFT_1618219 [Ramaria rubella]|nr:hypothetical protein K439DRAFT_1618219 [Ramaria rubella]
MVSCVPNPVEDQGSDGSLHRKWGNGSVWNGFQKVGGDMQILYDPITVLYSRDINIFVVTTMGCITPIGTWTGGTIINGTIDVQVFIIGTQAWLPSAGIREAGWNVPVRACCHEPEHGQTFVFAIGIDHSLHHAHLGPKSGWAPFEKLEGSGRTRLGLPRKGAAIYMCSASNLLVRSTSSYEASMDKCGTQGVIPGTWYCTPEVITRAGEDKYVRD